MCQSFPYIVQFFCSVLFHATCPSSLCPSPCVIYCAFVLVSLCTSTLSLVPNCSLMRTSFVSNFDHLVVLPLCLSSVFTPLPSLRVLLLLACTLPVTHPDTCIFPSSFTCHFRCRVFPMFFFFPDFWQRRSLLISSTIITSFLTILYLAPAYLHVFLSSSYSNIRFFILYCHSLDTQAAATIYLLFVSYFFSAHFLCYVR